MHAQFFEGNRKRLAEKLQGGLVCLSTYSETQSTGDMAFPFKQEANFWYLTGIDHAGWVLVYDGSTNESWLIAPNVEAVHELFDGSLTYESAKALSGVKTVIDAKEGDSLLRRLARKHSVVQTVDHSPYAEHFSFSLNPAITAHKKRLERIFGSVQDCQKDLAKLRSIKQPEEIKAITKAVSVTIDVFASVRDSFDSFKSEYEIEAEFDYTFKKQALTHAYDPIVASGAHACTLHYNVNSDKLAKNQLVLMDIGARVDGYSADITRTYAYGSATKRQKQVHAAVEQAHQDIISFLKPELGVEEYSSLVDERMKQALIELELLHSLDDHEAYRKYFPHAISHGLGIDTHDSLGSPRYFEENMVLTVEPGIYIPEEKIGVRIEDDILITAKGHKNLSAKLSTGL